MDLEKESLRRLIRRRETDIALARRVLRRDSELALAYVRQEVLSLQPKERQNASEAGVIAQMMLNRRLKEIQAGEDMSFFSGWLLQMRERVVEDPEAFGHVTYNALLNELDIVEEWLLDAVEDDPEESTLEDAEESFECLRHWLKISVSARPQEEDTPRHMGVIRKRLLERLIDGYDNDTHSRIWSRGDEEDAWDYLGGFLKDLGEISHINMGDALQRSWYQEAEFDADRELQKVIESEKVVSLASARERVQSSVLYAVASMVMDTNFKSALEKSLELDTDLEKEDVVAAIKAHLEEWHMQSGSAREEFEDHLHQAAGGRG